MLLDLSERAKFKVTGGDRWRFLNGQLTNDINELRPGETLYACALTAKGKLCADLYVTSAGEAFYLDTASVLQAPLLARLERYIIADDVSIEDVTTDFSVFHFLNRNAEQFDLEGAAFTSLAKEPFPVFASRSNRFASYGMDLWFPPAARALILETWRENPSTSETVENLRIERGIAVWGNELSENVIPNEAGLQDRAISFTKGCYLGQEVISRIKSVGHVNRHLRGLIPTKEILPQQGDKLVADPASMKEIGLITSVGKSTQSGATIALGFVRRGFDKSGTVLQLSREKILVGSVEVNELPLD